MSLKRKSRKDKQRRQKRHLQKFHGKRPVPKFTGRFTTNRFVDWFNGLSEYDKDQVSAELLEYHKKRGGTIDSAARYVSQSIGSGPADKEFKTEIAIKLAELERARRLKEIKKVEVDFVRKQKAECVTVCN